VFGLDKLDTLFVIWSFFLQIVLIVHFALRKPFFESYTIKFGWIVYALCFREILVILAGRISFPDLCDLWLLDRLYKGDRMAQSTAQGYHVPLCNSIFERNHVLLVAFSPALPAAVVCFWILVCDWYHTQYHLSLIPIPRL